MRRLLLFVITWVTLASAAPAFADTKAEARRYFQRGMALIDSGRFAEGVKDLEKAYSIRPHRNVLFNIGRAYASMGNVNKAVKYFERYIATNPRDKSSVQATLQELKTRQRLRRLVDEGMSAIAEGRQLEGIALLKRAYEQRPHASLLYNIARAYEDAGQSRRAIETYRRYLRSKPRDAKKVRQRLASLQRQNAEPPPPRTAPPPTRRRRRRQRVEPPPPPPPPVVGRTAPPPPPAQLKSEDLDRLAAMIVERLEETGALSPRVEEEPLVDATPQPGLPPTEVKSTTAAVAGADVQLEAKGGEAYDDVVVTASRRAESPLDAPNAVTILTEEDIRLSGARTIPDLLRRVPGMDVMALSYSEYNIAMRGFNRRLANKILVLIDGRSAYQDFLGNTLWRSLPINLQDVARVEVVRGPGSAIYGAYAYTGIVNIILKRPDEIRGAVAEVGVGNGERVEATFQYGDTRGPFGFRVGAGYDRGDKFDLEFDPSRVDYVSAAEDPELSVQIARVNGEVEYNVPDSNVRVFGGGSITTGKNELFGVAALRNLAVDATQYRAHAGVGSDLVSVRASYYHLDAQAAPQFFRTGTPSLGSSTNFDLLSLEPVFRPSFDFLGKHQLVFGGEYRFKAIEWDYLNEDQTENHFAAFFQDAWTITPQWSTIISARLDLHPLIGPLASPRLAVIFKPTPKQALRLSLGTAFRQPTMAETYLDLRASSPVAGALARLVGGFEDLDPENIATIDVGYRWQPDWGDLEGAIYLNRVSKLITRTPLQPTGPGEPLDPDAGGFVIGNSFYTNDPDNFYAIGTEFSARTYPVDGLDLGVSYAFQYIFNSRTKDRFTDSPLHKASAWGQLRTDWGLDIGTSVHIVSSQDWIEPQYDLDDPSGFDSTPLPIPTAVVLMGRVGYRMFEDKLEIGVAGTNLADFGNNRHREHPFGNRLEARIIGTVTGRL